MLDVNKCTRINSCPQVIVNSFENLGVASQQFTDS